jgi:hypothetical protein
MDPLSRALFFCGYGDKPMATHDELLDDVYEQAVHNEITYYG